MSESPLRLVKRIAEFQPIDRVGDVPRQRRGFYVLYKMVRRQGKTHFDVVYVGMATCGIRGRLQSHVRNKPDLWTHFSVYEVWENIRDEEIAELEGLFRHMYRKDSGANKLNVQKNFKKAASVRRNDLKAWT